MKKDLKFSEYPFRVPNQKKITAKLSALVELLKQAKTAKEADVAIKKMNKFGIDYGTETSII